VQDAVQTVCTARRTGRTTATLEIVFLDSVTPLLLGRVPFVSQTAQAVMRTDRARVISTAATIRSVITTKQTSVSVVATVAAFVTRTVEETVILVAVACTPLLT